MATNKLITYSQKFLEYKENLEQEERKYPFLKHPAIQIVQAWREAREVFKKLSFSAFLQIEEKYEKASPEEIEQLLLGDDTVWQKALLKDKKRRIYHALGACLAADAMAGLGQRKRLKSFGAGFKAP
jgi:hypothetical protein